MPPRPRATRRQSPRSPTLKESSSREITRARHLRLSLHAGPTKADHSMDNLRQAISEAYLADEDKPATALIAKAKMSPGEARATEVLARDLVSQVRAARPNSSGVDAFTQEYALSSEEGVMLMCLAEALLRVPDAETQDRLIRDKLAGHDWERHLGQSRSGFVNASTFALMLSGHVVEIMNTSR